MNDSRWKTVRAASRSLNYEADRVIDGFTALSDGLESLDGLLAYRLYGEGRKRYFESGDILDENQRREAEAIHKVILAIKRKLDPLWGDTLKVSKEVKNMDWLGYI